jgi:hypothetical protein
VAPTPSAVNSSDSARAGAPLPHQVERARLDLAAQHGVSRARRDVFGRDVAPLPVVRPQVGRVDAVGAGQFLHRAVLRKQRQRRHRLAGQLTCQVVEQGERGLLDGLDRRGVELDRAR